MGLKRRIVLDISQIKTPIELAAPEEVRQYASSPTDAYLEFARNYAFDAEAGAWRRQPASEMLPRMSMPEFLKMFGIEKQGVTCKGCGARADFETENFDRTITCTSCRRTVTFELFATEHR